MTSEEEYKKGVSIGKTCLSMVTDSHWTPRDLDTSVMAILEITLRETNLGINKNIARGVYHATKDHVSPDVRKAYEDANLAATDKELFNSGVEYADWRYTKGIDDLITSGKNVLQTFTHRPDTYKHQAQGFFSRMSEFLFEDITGDQALKYRSLLVAAAKAGLEYKQTDKDKAISETSKPQIIFNEAKEESMSTATKDKTEVKPKFENVTIEKRGKILILPEGMSYAEGRLWLSRQEEAEEHVVSVYANIPCFPLDGAVALRKAMEEIYGFAALADTPSFFGKEPPTMVQIEIPGGFATAILGRMQPPMFEGGFIEANLDKMALLIRGEVKKKFEAETQIVISKTKEILAQQSIYRGQAFILDLSYLGDEDQKERRFHPVNDAPKFMDVADVNEGQLILNQSTLFALTANIWTRIEQTEACRQHAIPLKHGALLAGAFGTGKTLTARVTASKCVRSGWTFIYLKTPSQLAHALKLAEMYAPAALFCEDIDEIIGSDRDADITAIMNTIDGVDTKEKPILTILTTNNPDNIFKGMIRPGRIDTIVHFHEPDAATAAKFVQLYSRDDDNTTLLAPDIDIDVVGQALAGFVPAFIAEAVFKAKSYAIHRHGTDIMGKVTQDDLVNAATALREHKRLMDGDKATSPKERAADGLFKALQFGIHGEDAPALRNGND